MKKTVLSRIINQRDPVSHMVFLVFSVFLTIILSLAGDIGSAKYFSLSVCILLFAQLEVFFFFGTNLFADLNFDRSPEEITRIVLFRFLIFIAGCLTVSLILFILLQYAGLWIAGEDLSKVAYNFFHTGIGPWFRSTIKGLSFGGVIFVILLWQTSLKREQNMREEKLIFQNETLKNQVNPHFLFNSLNTLSALVGTQPEIAEEFIHRLSAIYRYILENSSKDRVPLGVELLFIKDYFFLHKIRDDGKIQLEIQVEDSDNSEILPVSLQILVENAIKHNKATRESPLKIVIYVENKHIVVKNNLQKMAQQLSSTQIGLKNLAQRINLLTKKTLIIEETPKEFIVKIPLL
jgi:hypothetical protein